MKHQNNESFVFRRDHCFGQMWVCNKYAKTCEASFLTSRTTTKKSLADMQKTVLSTVQVANKPLTDKLASYNFCGISFRKPKWTCRAIPTAMVISSNEDGTWCTKPWVKYYPIRVGRFMKPKWIWRERWWNERRNSMQLAMAKRAEHQKSPFAEDKVSKYLPTSPDFSIQ